MSVLIGWVPPQECLDHWAAIRARTEPRIFGVSGWQRCDCAGVLARIERLTHECSEPDGWLAFNVRFEVNAARR